jgi:integrase
LRRGEIIGLDLTDVDFRGGRFTPRRSVYWKKRVRYVDEVKGLQLGPRLHRERNASTIRAAKTRSVDCLTARPRFLFLLHARGGIVTHGAARKAACERRDRDPPCLRCEPRARRVPTRRRTK